MIVSALTLLVGRHQGHLASKPLVVPESTATAKPGFPGKWLLNSVYVCVCAVCSGHLVHTCWQVSGPACFQQWFQPRVPPARMDKVYQLETLWTQVLYIHTHTCQQYYSMNTGPVHSHTSAILLTLLTNSFVLLQQNTQNDTKVFARDSIYAKRTYAIAIPSVCPSVRPSHGGISQKRLKLGSCNFHCTVAPSL